MKCCAVLVARNPATWCALLLATLLAVPAHSQSAPPPSRVSPGVTAAVTRARALADVGDGARARDLLDSLVEAAPPESPDASETLYWRALLSEEASMAERDWKRIVVEMPFSARASDALLRLSELDLLRHNPKLARQHVQQLLIDHPASSERAPALLILARAYFEERDAPRACGVLSTVRREAPISAVETRLQADEMQQQCRNVRETAFGTLADTTAPPGAPGGLAAGTGALPPAVPPRTPAITPAPPTGTQPRSAAGGTAATLDRPPMGAAGGTQQRAATTSATSTPERPPAGTAPGTQDRPATSTAAGRWTVQLAAYDTQAEADAFVKRLGAKGVDAHTTGSRKPFRVQTGQYATRAAAASVLAEFKKKGMDGFVTETPVP